MEIYNNIGSKDKGTYEQFCEYLSNMALIKKKNKKFI